MHDLDAIIQAIRDQLRPDANEATDRFLDEQTPITVRDVELARDRMFTYLALPEPLHELRARLCHEEGL